MIRWRILHDRYHLAPLRHLPLFGESPARLRAQGPRLGIGRASPDHAETQSDGADGRLSQDAGSADWRGHLLRQPVDHARPRAPAPGRGAADALAWRAEKTMFLPAVSIVFAKRPEVLPEGVLEDRVKVFGRHMYAV